MNALFILLTVVSFLVFFFGYCVLLVKAFREGRAHGWGALILGTVYTFFFGLFHWDDCKKGWLMNVVGGLVFGVVLFLASRHPASESWARPWFKLLVPIATVRPPAGGDPAAYLRPDEQAALQFMRESARKSNAGLIPATPEPEPVPPTPSEPAAPAAPEASSWWRRTPAPDNEAVAPATDAGSAAPAAAADPQWEQARALLRGAVMRQGDRAMAMVNGQMVAVNEMIAVDYAGKQFRFRIRAIDPDRGTIDYAPAP